MFQGSLDMKGAIVDIRHNPDCPGMEWIIRIVTSTACTAFECAVESEDLVSFIQN